MTVYRGDGLTTSSSVVMCFTSVSKVRRNSANTVYGALKQLLSVTKDNLKQGRKIRATKVRTLQLTFLELSSLILQPI